MNRLLNRGAGRVVLASLVAAGVAIAADRAMTQNPTPAKAVAKEPTLVPTNSPDYGSRPVAYIYGNTVVTRAELAEFLIARGGYEKVELLVNKKIIEAEAAKRGLSVTVVEMEAALQEDLKISNPPLSKKDFVTIVLPKYGKTFYEWMEDVVRPRLLLSKMCWSQVKVTDEDLQKAYEREYGEKRAVKIIIWPMNDDLKTIQRLWGAIRNDDQEFDRVARSQANPSLAATAGEIKPIAKHMIGDDKDKIVEKMAYSLNDGEVSQIFQTNQGYMVIKLLKKVPADTTMSLDKVKAQLTKDVFDRKLAEEMPKQFAILNESAKPNILLSGPPLLWQIDTARTVTPTEPAPLPANTPPQGTVIPAGGMK